jgi:hypothetical protein
MNPIEHPSGPAAAFFQDTFAIDSAVLTEMLGVALGRGGEYAELYFEYRKSGSNIFEDQAVKNVGGGVMQGLGVRVIQGDAVGYAYTEDLSREAMRRAADTAAQISTRNRTVDQCAAIPARCSLPPAAITIISASTRGPASAPLRRPKTQSACALSRSSPPS